MILDDNDTATPNDQGLKITTEGRDNNNNEVINRLISSRYI